MTKHAARSLRRTPGWKSGRWEAEVVDLHYWTKPNGRKVGLFLEEAGLPYRIVPVHIGRGDQFAPEFLRIPPNNRIPAIVDHAPADAGEPLSVFESAAILLYLADKTMRFIAQDLRGRNVALQWLFWQMGGLGPCRSRWLDLEERLALNCRRGR